MTAARFFCARRLPALSLVLLLSCGDEGAGLADPESSKAISALGNEAGYPGYCSDGECNPHLGEDCASCPEDYGDCPYPDAGDPGYCSDGECNPYLGEDCASCPEDCGSCPYDGGPYDGGAPEGGPLEAGSDGGGVDAGGGGGSDGDGGSDAGGGGPDGGDGPDGGGCTSDTECDDGDFCNGEEACVDGECQSAEPPDCDDDKVCTTDCCDEAAEMCVNAFQRGLCTCGANTAVPDITYRMDKEWEVQEVSCPVVGGSVKERVAISGSATGRTPHCNNGCQSSVSADLGGEIQSEICGATGATFSVALSGSYSVSSRQCLECDKESCEEFCADGACVTQDASGSASMRVSKFYGYKWENSTSYYSAEVKCGATVSGSVEGSIGGQLKTDEGYTCGECEECTRVNISGNVGVGGRGDCYVKLDVLSFTRQIGCNRCSEVNTYATLGLEGREGECGNGLCGFGRVSANAAARTPTYSFGIGWFSVSVQCSASASGCAELNTCGSCQCGGASCYDVGVTMSCRVGY